MKQFYGLLLILFLSENSWAQKAEDATVNKDPLRDSVSKYLNIKQYRKVVTFAEQWVTKLQTEKKAAGPEYGTALNAWGDALNRTGKSSEAEPILLQCLEIRKQTPGENHPDYATTLINLGLLYKNTGRFSKAEPLYLQAFEIRLKTYGEKNNDVASVLNSLGNLYSDIGNYQKSEVFYLRAIESWKKSMGEDNPILAIPFNNLGNLSFFSGDYPKAENYYSQALEIKRKTEGQNSQSVGVLLHNLGNVALKMGNLPKATSYFLQSLEIKRKILDAGDPDLAATLNNIANLYSDVGNNSIAERYYLEGLEILKKSRGENHPEVAASLNNLGVLYSDAGRFAKAETVHRQALNIRKKVLGENHPDFAVSLEDIGSVYWKVGQTQKAETSLLQSLQIRRKVLGDGHLETATSVLNLASLNFSTGRMEKAESWFLDWNAKKQAQIQRYFPYLSDQEKERFYETTLSESEDVFKSFCIERYAGKKTIATDLYNDQLATKGLLLSSSSKWRHRIRTSGDTGISALFKRWEASHDQLNKLLQSTDSAELVGIDSVQSQTEKLEKELSLRSEGFARLTDKKSSDWKDVQKALKPGEAAIEMIRIKKFGIQKTVSDSSDPMKPRYILKGLTDTIFYAALIVKPESLFPELVLLRNGNELEGKALSYYKNAIQNRVQDSRSYKLFWDKIRTKLGDTRRVYFSPDGVYHNINLNTLQNPKTKKYLVEELDISLVTGTKDLLNPESGDSRNQTAEMVGFPSYYNPGATVSISTEYRKSPTLTYKLNMASDETIAELPATKIEVDKISEILQTKGWQVNAFTGDKALEETIKESNSPKVLHIATHGFFQPDTTKGSNPLLHSGLMLTGAGSTLKGERKDGTEDGILTAYEAMNLNLDNTDLVVLSACETGLGEIKNGEGVYGLQRAFKVAGAKTLIMSLWKVNDEATQELMVGFYKHWLSPPASKGRANTTPSLGAGGHLRSAFLQAQKELKAKYPDPYFWGAFVMVGE
jgi:CHAT domain-containing protein/Tfp pilus assembly protein PilF